MSEGKTRLAIFASGTGSNAEAILQYEHIHPNCGYQTVLVVSNKQTAGVVQVAERYGVVCRILDEKEFPDNANYVESLIQLLQTEQVEFIALAGYLKKIPDILVRQYEKRMVNIHPSLLPKFGGAGMYGMKVHEAVVQAREHISGCTIHWVSEEYDAGAVIAQFSIPLSSGEDGVSLSAKIRKLEHEKYPELLSTLTTNPLARDKHKAP